ncbi:cell division protein FtsJ [Paenibacillus selenitireducens]|uniref:Cell division protein FtsJ n=1 Tax=Paenibacillus selenitireducens TaxID=1324314 RepID=A0A1T2X430_9BACL|nr:cyclic-phosphate processing receiver domain-containing protein [Paenibacillus selenitireducens]OPA74661.1 cell division protein FtsJ [Paenibacillus selenitireducens]
MVHVFLDDFRRCPVGFVYARSAEECLLLLEHEEVDILSLDHDLGIHQTNGTQLVKQMVLRGLYPREIYLHTSSFSGRKAMYELLYQNKPEHVILHDGPMPQSVIQRIREASDAGSQ